MSSCDRDHSNERDLHRILNDRTPSDHRPHLPCPLHTKPDFHRESVSNKYFSVISAATHSAPPSSPTITLSVYPGHTLWSGESLILECKVSTARHRRPGTSAVWHRALLDPAGRRLRARGNSGHNHYGRRKQKATGRLVVRERTAELISHGEMLLLSDDRFSVEVKRYEDGVVYRLQV